ncbi:MlaD family protein [Nocardioides zeae]
MTAAAPRAVVGVAGLALVVLVSACSGVRERADQLQPDAVGDDQVTVTASFDDALNLPAGAAVKLDGVRVGKVVGIDAVDYRAQVVMAIDEDAGVPVGSAYRLRSTTALGEVYVEVTPAPAGGAPWPTAPSCPRTPRASPQPWRTRSRRRPCW